MLPSFLSPSPLRNLGGGIALHTTSDGKKAVVKRGPAAGTEGRMLRTLAPHLPVPEIYHLEADLLVMEYVEDRGLSPEDEEEAGRLLAAMHDLSRDTFGLEYDTAIGPHFQPNPREKRWIPFFREHRLLFMARACYDEGKISRADMDRTEALAARLEEILEEPDHPSLLHGDVWGGNVLSGPRGPVFIDPAVYRGHSEMELAFITLFHTFGERFFKSYGEIRPVDPVFFRERKELYNLYPLLVHVRSFGGGYLESFRRNLRLY